MKREYSKESAIAQIKKVGVDFNGDSKTAIVKHPVGIHTKGALDYLRNAHKAIIIYK